MEAEAADQNPSVKGDSGKEQWPMKIRGWEGSMGLADQEGEKEQSKANGPDVKVKTEPSDGGKKGASG